MLVEKLADGLVKTWPQIIVNTVFGSKKKHSHQVFCKLFSTYTDGQAKLIKAQIELIATSLLTDLSEKINLAKVVG